tara:strand:- start:1 stop:207 length:207 start_codon:yes stop_codon:yes gene_type:complete
MKKKPSRLSNVEFRVDQIEMALLNLMYVVANQEKELPSFISGMKKAEKASNDDGELFSLIVNDDGAEA